jgi:hypothetical protein
MEGNPIFSNTARIEIQGNRVLRFVDADGGQAEYQVIGFDDPVITVRDRRRAGLRAIAQLLDTGDLYGFAPQFNVPAHVTISVQYPSHILVELCETDDPAPAHTLWIVAGIKDRIPVFDYLFERIAPLEDDGFSFFALYRRVPQPEALVSELSAAN